MNNDNNSLTHSLSSLGTEFAHDSMDSVDSDVESAFDKIAPDCDIDDESDSSYIFVNIAEEMVRNKVGDLMKECNMCTCERCTNDVVALALNKMPPKYVVTPKGKLYARINACLPQYQTDLVTAISEACLVVKNNTRHNLK